jgi:hypothetical protein
MPAVPRSLNDPFYDPPNDPAGTVLDPFSPTFGPIVRALIDGEFDEAARLTTNLAARAGGRRQPCIPGQTTLS